MYFKTVGYRPQVRKNAFLANGEKNDLHKMISGNGS